LVSRKISGDGWLRCQLIGGALVRRGEIEQVIAFFLRPRASGGQSLQ
jgi:hypothetical protein